MTSKVRRFLAGAAAACLLPAFLSGCSGQEQQQGAASESGEKITLTIWDNQDNRALGYAVNAYTLEHPNVEIKVVNHAKATMENLPDEVDAGTAPDIVGMDQVYAVSLGNAGYLADLTEYGAQNITDRFLSSCIDSLSYNDKLYALPFDANTITLLYNQDMLDKAGVAVPQTFDELMAADEAIKSKVGSNTYAFTAPFYQTGNDNWKSFNFCFFLWGMGGELLSDDLTEAAFNSDSGVEALEKILELKEKSIVSDTYQEGDFLNGRSAAMMYNGTWQLKTITGLDKKANFGMALLPQLKEGVKAYSGLGLNCYGVTSSSKAKEQAYDFLQFYCSGANYQTAYCQQNNMLPSLKEAQEDDYFQDEEWQVMLEQLSFAKYRPSVPGWEKIEQMISKAIDEAVSGSKTAKQALDDAASQVNELLQGEETVSSAG